MLVMVVMVVTGVMMVIMMVVVMVMSLVMLVDVVMLVMLVMVAVVIVVMVAVFLPSRPPTHLMSPRTLLKSLLSVKGIAACTCMPLPPWLATLSAPSVFTSSSCWSENMCGTHTRERGGGEEKEGRGHK